MFHVKHEGWNQAAERIGVALPPGADSRLGAFEELLIARGAPMGVIAPGDVDRVRERHILDSLRAAALVEEADGSSYDLGSGGGLPGVVLAIACPNLGVTLVEVRRNRAALLDIMVTELGLANARIYPRRSQTLRDRVDLVFARAFAPPNRAWEAAEPLLVPGGRLVYWAGERFDPSRDVPSGVQTTLFRTPALARSGALAMMSRQ